MEVNLNECKLGDLLISEHGMVFTYMWIDEKNAPYRHMVQFPDGHGGSRADNGIVFIDRPLPSDHNIVEIKPLDRRDKNDVTIIDVSDLEHEYAKSYTKDWAIQFSNGTVVQFDTEYQACEAQRIHREIIGINPDTGK